MTVLQILPELNVGGVETGTVDFAKYLVREGHSSIVVSNGGKLVKQLEREGSQHVTLGVHKKSLFQMIKMIKPLRKIIQQHEVDIVHARSRVPAWIAFFACRKTNASFITTCHGHYGNRFFSRIMSWSKLIIVPSQVIGRHMIDQYRVPSESIRVIPRGVDLKRFKNLKETASQEPVCRIAIVGRITPLKGHKYFLRAMTKVTRVIPYARIWVIGEPPAKKPHYLEELKTLTRRLGIEEKVEFLGRRSDVPQLLKQCDVLVMSSIEPESFGRVILEAQAVGVPVVATRVGGVLDIIDDNITGLLILPKDPDAIAASVMRLIKDKSLRNRLSAAAREKLRKEFTIDKMAQRTLAVYEELLESQRILVIKLSSIGDVVLVTASLKALRQKFPKAYITCLVGKPSKDVLKNCPYVDETMTYDYEDRDKGRYRFFKLALRLKSEHYDKVIDFQNNLKSHILSAMSMARETYGYNNGKAGFLLTHKIKNTNTHLPPVEHQFQVLKMLGINYSSKVRLELWPGAKEKKDVNALFEGEWLANSKRIVGINMAASDQWPTKNWPIEHIAKLCDMLTAKNVRVLITGMLKDRPRLMELMRLTKTKPADLVGKTNVLQLAEVIRKCQAYITPDSAPLHVAAAVHTPIIAFFGPTDPARHLPPAKHLTVIAKPLTCAPCYGRQCKILTHACMQDIAPEEVADKVFEVLKA